VSGKSENYFIVVTELDESFARRDQSKPHLYVGISKSPPAESFEEFKRGEETGSFMGHHVRLREDLAGNISSSDRKQVKNDRVRLIKSLKGKGFAVNGDLSVWCVYVVDLDASSFTDVGRGYIYVGQSAHTPEERYVQHKAPKPTDGSSDLASRKVRKLGLRINQELTLQTVFFTREAALKKEKAYASELCRAGYLVEAGHVTPDPKTCKTKKKTKQRSKDE
jgi:hypothetical protein